MILSPLPARCRVRKLVGAWVAVLAIGIVIATGLASLRSHGRVDSETAALLKLEGVWVLREQLRSDRPTPFLCFEGRQAFELDSMANAAPAGTYSVHLDPANRAIDLTAKMADGSIQVHRGIYDASGDSLRICVAPTSQPRPSSFAFAPPGAAFLCFERSAFPLAQITPIAMEHTQAIDQLGVRVTASVPSIVRSGRPGILRITFENARDEAIHLQSSIPSPIEVESTLLNGVSSYPYRGGKSRRSQLLHAWHPGLPPGRRIDLELDLSRELQAAPPGIYICRLRCQLLEVDSKNRPLDLQLALCFRLECQRRWEPGEPARTLLP